jgi:hypothetical protein
LSSAISGEGDFEVCLPALVHGLYNIYLFGGVRDLTKELCCGLKAPEAVVSNRLRPRRYAAKITRVLSVLDGEGVCGVAVVLALE